MYFLTSYLNWCTVEECFPGKLRTSKAHFASNSDNLSSKRNKEIHLLEY